MHSQRACGVADSGSAIYSYTNAYVDGSSSTNCYPCSYCNGHTRACTHAYGHPRAHAYGHPRAHAYPYSNAHTYAYTDAHSNSYANSNTYAHCNTDTHSYTNARSLDRGGNIRFGRPLGCIY